MGRTKYSPLDLSRVHSEVLAGRSI